MDNLEECGKKNKEEIFHKIIETNKEQIGHITLETQLVT